MPAIYQGDKKIVDRYIGETLITRAYQGDKLIFDAYSELSGTLPLAVRSRASQILKNYRIYGTASGAGVETENLWDGSPESLIKRAVNNSGGIVNTLVISVPGTYTARCFVKVDWYCYAKMYNIPNDTYGPIVYLSTPSYEPTPLQTITGVVDAENIMLIYDALGTGDYIKSTNVFNNVQLCITAGSTAPSSYIPYGYKLPITVTSNGTTTDYPVYVGDSQLGEEEYVDYAEQKIYKRGENEFPFAEEGTFTFGNGSVISDGSGTFIINTENNDTNVPSELIPLTTPYTIPQTNGEYTFYLGGNDVNPGLLIVFYDSERNLVDDWMYNSTWRKESDIPLMAGRTITYIGFRINTNYSGSANMSVTPMISKNNNLTAYVPYIQLTDPPVPLPDIALPKAIATIDTEEEFKYHSAIKGRINPVHYAYRINADTAEITYLADNKDFTPASMGSTTFDYGSWENAFFMPRPCMLKSNGKVDYYLDPNDYSKKLDGTASDIADPTYDGNVMLEFPKIYYKFEPTGDDGEGGTFHCSNVKLDDDYECWCNYDANNNEIDHFYVAAYNAVILDNKMRSLSGYALTQENGADTTTGATEIAAARANNQNGIDEWYTYLLADHQLLTYLATLMCKHVDHQTKFGRGIDSGSTAAKRAYVTGTLNDKGLFWGDTSSGTQAVKIFGIENFYSCVWKRTAGLIGTSTGYAYKLTHGTKDGSTATSFNTTGSGYKTIARTKPADGYITTMHYESNGFWIPATTGANRYGDYYYNGNYYALVGGSSTAGSKCGSWYVSLYNGVSDSSWFISSALSCKPKA